MSQTQNAVINQPSEKTLPSFSIVYETENLSSVELDNIYRSLASISQQEISPEQANEFLIIDAGNAPPEVIEELCSKYPWLTVEKATNIGYYEAKMLGAKLVTGDIVVFCDSDCEYTPNWLKDILSTFLKGPEVQVVAGETSTAIRSIYELAIASNYFFPRFSKKEEPYPTTSYFLNAVAFRREFLLENPIPTNLPLYRGNCQLHCYYLCKLKGYQIWKHPLARAKHEPPTSSFIFWRSLLAGRDRIYRQYIKSVWQANPELKDFSQVNINQEVNKNQSIKDILTTTFRSPFKLRMILSVIREKPSRLFLLPLALPFILWFEILRSTGTMITYLKPNWLMETYKQKEEQESQSQEVVSASPAK